MIINKGKIVADGTSEQLRKQAQGSEILRIQIPEADKNLVYDALKMLETVALVDFIDPENNIFQVHSKEGTQSAKAIFNLCSQKGWYIGELTPIETKLEDVFREVTTN